MNCRDNALGFIHWGRSFPEHLAISDGQCSLNYADLRQRALLLAGQMVHHGVVPGDIVAVACDRSVESVVAILATVCAGAAYLPLDASYPLARIVEMLEDARPRLLVTTPAVPVELLRSLPLPVIESGSAVANGLVEPVLTDDSAPAYVLFTSGSTGRPKGVVVPRRALHSLVEWHLAHPRLGQSARVLLFPSFVFDPSVRDVFVTLATGGSLILASESQRRDPFLLLELMREQRVERATLPFVLRAVAQAYVDGGALPEALRDVGFGGESLEITPAIRQLFAALPDAVLHNEYGPTESCVMVTSHPLAGDPSLWPERPDLGFPLSHVRLHVVDEDQRTVPDGVAGELLIGGVCLADGYINQSALTAERFMPLIHPDALSEMVYHSGDRVQRAIDGRIIFLGRMDDQVKVAGHRVELGDVTQALASHPEVADLAVVAPAGPEGRRLVAHVVLNQQGLSLPDVRVSMREHLAARLPAFACPQLVIFHDALPLTPSGKVDRRRLEDESLATGDPISVPAQASLEARISSLWCDLLRLPVLGADDNVFDSGADSLLVMIFVTRLRAIAGRSLAASAIYTHPTPRQQVQALSAAPAPTGEPAVTAKSTPDGVDLPMEMPLSEGQMERWFTCQFGGEAALAHNESATLRLDGPLDAFALKDALQRVWGRHEALHLTFADDGSSEQFHAELELPSAELNFSTPAADAEARLKAWCARQAAQPFDLSVGPLVRFTLIRMDQQRHVLHVIGHHLVMDGWSLALFITELGACYSATVKGRQATLAPAGSFRRYLSDQRVRRAAGGSQASLDYWRAVYATTPSPLRLPADRPAPAEPSYAAATERRALTPELTSRLRGEARRRGISLYSLLLSGFAVLMARLSGQADFSIAVPFGGLALDAMRPLIGDGVSTLPLRMSISPETSFAELARQTHAALLDAAEHRDVTLTGIQRMLGLRAGGGEAALTGVTFNLLPRVAAEVFEGLAHELRECSRGAMADWELFFNVNDSGNVLSLDTHYSTARYDDVTVRRWLLHYETVLSGIAAMGDIGGGDAAAGDIALLDDAGRFEVLTTWNDTALEYDREQGFTALVEAQMNLTPERIAVQCGGEQMDYATLDKATRSVAQALRRRGIGRGDMVGVCIPRSVDMLLAVLGILRCGAAYVPLDPEFPDARLRHMAEHSRLRYVLMAIAGKVPDIVAAGRELLAVADLRAESGEDPPLPRVKGDDLAYVLFTSGSTGEPKGVRVLHRNLVNFLLSMRREPGFEQDDVMCATTTLSFDIAATELYLPLITGARTVIATEVQRRDPRLMWELIEQSASTVLQITPSLLQLLQVARRQETVRKLRLFVGGEALPLVLAQTMAGDCRELWNLYGPTETTVWSTVARIHPQPQVIPLGKPIANTQVYVLDPRGQPVPPGVVGEMWIGGDGVAGGYLFRPALTDERFVADPFAGGSARMYRTGDLGCWRDGMLYFHGRADNQIKIRGYRIEPGDIEAAVASDARVRECVVVVRRFGENDLRLVLYVVPAADDPGLAARLRSQLRKRLPEYMRPQHIECLTALPKTPNGKIDRNALPAPAAATHAHQGMNPTSRGVPVSALDDPREDYLAAVWRDLVGVTHLSGSDNFFDIGGHSLLALEFTTRVHRETGAKLSLLHIATGTLTSLAAELPDLASLRVPKDSILSRLRRKLGRD